MVRIINKAGILGFCFVFCKQLGENGKNCSWEKLQLAKVFFVAHTLCLCGNFGPVLQVLHGHWGCSGERKPKAEQLSRERGCNMMLCLDI